MTAHLREWGHDLLASLCEMACLSHFEPDSLFLNERKKEETKKDLNEF